MVLQVGADPRQVRHHWDPEPLEVGRTSDAGQLEELWAVDGAAAEDDLTTLDALRAATLSLDIHGHRTAGLEDDPGHEGAGPDRQVLPSPDRPQVRLGRAQAPTAVDRP